MSPSAASLSIRDSFPREPSPGRAFGVLRGAATLSFQSHEDQTMATARADWRRPPIHLLASESDMVGSLALQVEHRHPVVAAMLLEEIERAELHELETLPDTAITIGSEVDFVDERTRRTMMSLPCMQCR